MPKSTQTPDSPSYPDSAPVPNNAKSWQQIRHTMSVRRMEDSPLKRMMIQVRERYNGDYIIPLPEVENEPTLNPPIPNLIADAIDHAALQASSVEPEISVPAINPNKERGVRSQEYANIRRKAYYATWYHSSMELNIARAYRHLFGYGDHCLVVIPDPNTTSVRIEVRDPLTAYPDPIDADDVRRPTDIGFVFGRSTSWLLSNFPEVSDEIGPPTQQTGDQIWDLVEWIDEYQIVIGILGPRHSTSDRHPPTNVDRYGYLLRRYPNRLNHVPVASTRRVALDRVSGQVSSMIPNVDLLGKLTALDVLAAEKAIFPDRFIIGSEFGHPELLSDRWHDGREGVPNLLANTQQIGELNSSPGPMTHPVIDRIESSVRQTAGPSPMQSGMNDATLRTGRAVDALQSINIEPRIQELQRTMSRSLTFLNESIHETYLSYFPSQKFHLFSGWPSDTGLVEFTPNEHFESPHQVVYYPFPGADAATTSSIVMQTEQAGLLSKRTARRKHPYVQDAESEERTTREESIDEALLTRLQTEAAEGAIPITDLARMRELISEGHHIHEAIKRAQEEAQERQATPAGEDEQMMPPEAAPGFAPGAEQPLPEGAQPAGPTMGGGQGGGPQPSPEEFQQILQAIGGQR